MNYKVIYGKNDLVYTGFLALPGKLYQKNELTQDYDTEYKLLHEKHTLSKYFNITPFVVIDKNSQMPVARCMLTYYPEDDVAYFGFFECIGQQEIAEQLLDTVSKKAKKDGKTKLSGPVDASFWIKYRLKINLFDRIPYTGEPYNKNYYYKLLSDRSLIPISSFCDYLQSGVCETLEGHEGCYNKFDLEVRLDTIISRIDDVIDNLDQIKFNQHTLYEEVVKCNEKLDNLSTGISEMTNNITGSIEEVKAKTVAAINGNDHSNTMLEYYAEETLHNVNNIKWLQQMDYIDRGGHAW